MGSGWVERILSKSRESRTRRERMRALVIDEAFFLLIAPWLAILPASVLCRSLPTSLPRPVELGLGCALLLAGLAYSLWAVISQWRHGGGTPALNAPTQRLVRVGPYRYSRNPIQLGSSLYVFGLGTLAVSAPTGAIAATIAFGVGVLYIKAIEEKELKARFGEAYDQYCRETPFVLPFGPRTSARPTPTNYAEVADRLPAKLATRGRVLVGAAYVYDQVQPFVTLGQEARMDRWLTEQLRPRDGDRVLDVGCGTGSLAHRIAERYPSCSVEGIDASGPMIEQARRKRSTPNCSFRQALAEDLPYPDGHFDQVVSSLFFHHVDRDLKRRCLNEIRRTLKPGGRLVIADMDKPYTALGWLLSYGAWLLFRQPEIKENIDGVLRTEIQHAGFVDLEDLERFSGYISVFSARRSR